MNNTKERNLINIIRYTPSIFIIIFSLIITNLFLTQKEKIFTNDIQNLEKEYYQTNKQRVKEEIDKIYNIIEKEQIKSTSLLKKSIKERVDQTHKLLDYIYTNTKKQLGEKEAKKITLETLRQIKYNEGKGYFFMFSLDGIAMMHPILTKLENSSFIEYKDAKGTKIFKDMKNILKTKESTFYEWYWHKPHNNKKQYKKIGYFKKFEPLNAYIGTGEYLDEFERRLKQRMINLIQTTKYNKDGYIFLFDTNGVCLAHKNKTFIGQNRLNIKNSDNIYVAKELVDFVKDKQSGYMTYMSSFNTDKKAISNKKISYIKKFEKWGWILGTGFYTEALNSKINQKREKLLKEKNERVSEIIIASFIITSILLIVSFLISKSIEKIFKSYKKQIKQEIEQKQLKESLLLQQSKMATMGEMIANITHQWKQPLSYISTASSGVLLEKEYETLTDEKLIESISGIERSVNYLSHTIDDFKDFFSPNNKKEEFYILRLIKSVTDLLGTQLKKQNIELVNNIDNNFRVKLSRNLLLQVLINLVKNSSDALILNNQDEKKLIFIDSISDDKNLIISIKDNAGGIDDSIIDKVFEHYFTTKGKKGTGIGLYMSKEIIQTQMAGELSFENEEFEYDNKLYKGACFYIKIPLG